MMVLIALVCHSGRCMAGVLWRASHTFTACRGTHVMRWQLKSEAGANPVLATAGKHAAAALRHKGHV